MYVCIVCMYCMYYYKSMIIIPANNYSRLALTIRLTYSSGLLEIQLKKKFLNEKTYTYSNYTQM